MRAAIESGIPVNQDSNAASQGGVGHYQSAIFKGRRVSTADAFLRPAMRKFGIVVRTDCQVSRIIFEGGRATGVAYTKPGHAIETEVKARAGVIVSAGAINSPKLLQLSGIGPAALLREHAIPMRLGRSGVGQNLRDHYSPRLVARAKAARGSMNGRERGLNLVGEGLRWLVGQPNVAISPALIHVFWKSRPELVNPDFALVFTPASYRRGYIGQLDRYPGAEQFVSGDLLVTSTYCYLIKDELLAAAPPRATAGLRHHRAGAAGSSTPTSITDTQDPGAVPGRSSRLPSTRSPTAPGAARGGRHRQGHRQEGGVSVAPTSGAPAGRATSSEPSGQLPEMDAWILEKDPELATINTGLDELHQERC